MRATPIDALTAHLWKHFHGDERCYPPGYIHALDALYEMGIFANVEMVTLPGSLRYPTLDVAVEEFPGEDMIEDIDLHFGSPRLMRAMLPAAAVAGADIGHSICRIFRSGPGCGVASVAEGKRRALRVGGTWL